MHYSVYKSNALESQGTDSFLYTSQEEVGNDKTTPQHVHLDETPTALESQGTDSEMLQVSVKETDPVSSHEIALESQGTYIMQVSCHYVVNNLDSLKTHSGSTSSHDIRALESQGRRSTSPHTPPNTTGRNTTPNMFNALESQEKSCIIISQDDLSALESQGREETHSTKPTHLESQETGCTLPAKSDALESQGEVNSISSVASEEAFCESSALESQGKDDDYPSQAAMFKISFTNGSKRLSGGEALPQKSKVTCGSDSKGSSTGQGHHVVFTDSTQPSSCFVGFQPSTKVITLGPIVHEFEQWQPSFIGPSKVVLVYKHQATHAPPIIKRFYATMEAEYNHLVQFE